MGRAASLACGLALLAMTSAATAAVQCAPPAGFPNPELLRQMARGVNLTGWDAADPAERPTRGQLAALRERGFTHVRLPLDLTRLGGEQGADYRTQIVDRLAGLLALDYAVSLDLHAGDVLGAAIAADPQTGAEALVAAWKPLAARISGFDPDKVAVELLNEPAASRDAWNAALAVALPALRAMLPATTLVVGPAGPQRHEELASLELPDDPNIVLAVHYYDPFVFTHQGADWGPAGDPVRDLGDLPFPAGPEEIDRQAEALRKAGKTGSAEALEGSRDDSWTAERIAAAFAGIGVWSRAAARPVIANEFGVLAWKAPRRSRLAWLAAVREGAEAACIGWTHWDFAEGFGLIDPATGMPDADAMDALAPER